MTLQQSDEGGKEGRSLTKKFSSFLCGDMRLFSKPHHSAETCAIDITQDHEKIIIYPRGLNITWGNDKRHWQLPSQDQRGPAEMLQVSWLEVTGSTSKVEAGKKYRVGFRVSLKPEAFGWEGCDVYIMAKIGKKGKFNSQKVSLMKRSYGGECFDIPQNPLEITVAAPPRDCCLYFGMYEVWSQKWKGGLIIHHAFLHQLDD